MRDSKSVSRCVRSVPVLCTLILNKRGYIGTIKIKTTEYIV